MPALFPLLRPQGTALRALSTSSLAVCLACPRLGPVLWCVGLLVGWPPPAGACAGVVAGGPCLSLASPFGQHSLSLREFPVLVCGAAPLLCAPALCIRHAPPPWSHHAPPPHAGPQSHCTRHGPQIGSKRHMYTTWEENLVILAHSLCLSWCTKICAGSRYHINACTRVSQQLPACANC